MSEIGRCNFKDCERKNDCERYKKDYKDDQCYDFKNICNKNNNYKYIMLLNKSVVAKNDKNKDNSTKKGD